MANLDIPLLLDLTLRAFLVMFVILVVSRIFGLRFFSKMSGFDFAVTVAIGSVLATSVTAPDQSVWVPVMAILALFIWQTVVSSLRIRATRTPNAWSKVGSSHPAPGADRMAWELVD